MSIIKHFECENCGAEGKIVLKGTDHQYQDIVCCPVCGSDIYDEDVEDVDE